MDGDTTVRPRPGAPASDMAVGKGRVGIIDVGSNSIRLVVYERASRAPLPVFNEKVLCGLARGLMPPAASTPTASRWRWTTSTASRRSPTT